MNPVEQEWMERYVYAVTRRLPKSQRQEVARELEELIGDMLEDGDTMESVLARLGDPAEFAKKYQDGARYLIGPAYFENYVWLLRIVLICTAAASHAARADEGGRGAAAVEGAGRQKEAYEQLANSSINFQGNIEGREVVSGVCDVVVADGFSGNIFLKSSEGLALSIMGRLKEVLMGGTISKIVALLLAKQIKGMKKDFDYSEEGGAPILGLKGPVLKIHGSSKAYAVYNAILKARDYVESDVTGQIEKAIAESDEISSGEAVKTEV